MVAYNFQKQFVPDIKSGKKRSTFRPIGKRRHAQPGEMLQLYTGMRTQQCELIMETECRDFNIAFFDMRGITLDNDGLPTVERPDIIARVDGFRDYEDMYRWFVKQYGALEFRMVRIGW